MYVVYTVQSNMVPLHVVLVVMLETVLHADNDKMR